MHKFTTGIEVFCFVSAWLLIAAFAWSGGTAFSANSPSGLTETGTEATDSASGSPLIVVVPSH